MKYYFLLIIPCILFTACGQKGTKISENIKEFKTWEKLSLDFEGPVCAELSNPNPFTDYRMDVEFESPTGEIYKVPGFYAANGNAGETSDSTGNIWRVNFCPGKVGKWNYKVSFVKGKNIAAQLKGGETAGFFDGVKGFFNVSKNTLTDSLDFRTQGKLEYVGKYFLQFKETGKYFIKGGANSPEVLLEYAEFDNTPSDRTYPKHINDWEEGNPLWKKDKGKGIIGMVNYVSSLGLNSYYFLSMNAYGDGKKAWPWIHADSITRYDCSKLEQWDVLFRYMNQKGVLVNLVLTETENESYFEERELGKPEGFANSRKIYFREMIARFGYLPGITWNLGEENGWDDEKPFQKANTDQQRKDFCDYLRSLTYYQDHISVHNGPSDDDHIYTPLYGHQSITGPAFQWDFGKNIYENVLKLRLKSDSASHPWVVSLDEPYVDPPTRDLNEWRIDNVWPTFMAGGAGIELYIGAGLDVKEQDLRPYEAYYKTMTIATNFFNKYVPFHEVAPDTSFQKDIWVLRKKDELFVVYIKNTKDLKLDLPKRNYTISWYDPVLGGKLQTGSLSVLSGGDGVSIGLPPAKPEQDWVCLIKVK